MAHFLTLSPILPYIILIIGFVLLIKGADYFVEGCSSVATLFRIPPIIIGLTVAALGTSAPEAAVSITSSLKGANDMAVSNVIGSNIFNLLLVIGVCSLIRPMKVSSQIIIRDYPICTAITALLFLMVIDYFKNGLIASTLTRIDGIFLLTIFIAYIFMLVMTTLNHRKKNFATVAKNETIKTLSTPRSAVYILCGALAIAVGGNFVVECATNIATSFNISTTLIGLTVVALGTSLPELVTSIVASTKGENDLAIGNVVGSNIFNILFVLGIAATVSPIDLTTISNPQFTMFDTLILLIVTIIINIFILIKKDISRLEGTLMVLMYAGYLGYILIR